MSVGKDKYCVIEYLNILVSSPLTLNRGLTGGGIICRESIDEFSK